LQRADDRRRAARGARGAIERGKKPIAQTSHCVTAKADDLLPHRLIVSVEQGAPLPVAKRA
jgi:hypothetical protein